MIINKPISEVFFLQAIYKGIWKPILFFSARVLHFISLRPLYLCPGNAHLNAGVRMHKLLSSDSEC